ncbi:hypothetical protein [Streptomyces sp. NPDC001269]
MDAHLVIGTSTPQRLYRIVQMNNRRDRVHPPLEFDALYRPRALGVLITSVVDTGRG